MRAYNLSKDTLLAQNLSIADTFLKRFAGLMGKKVLPAGDGLLITPCNSIHMFFMKFPLDVLFLDKNNVVVHLIEEIKPWRLTKIISKAYSTIELPVGTIRKSGTQVGDRVLFKS